MLKSVKNIRKLNNVKMLFLSNDLEVKSAVESDFDEYFKELKLVSSAVEALKLLKESRFDMLLIDSMMEDKNLDEFCEDLENNKISIPRLIISSEDTNENIVTAINCNAYTFLSKPIKQKDLRLAIIMCLNQTKRTDKLEFQNGIYFDEYRDQFYKEGGTLIEFTKLEKSFLKLLISKKSEIVDYELIKEVVWKGKDMSIFTMRNIVNKIRQKTYYEIIKNKSNRGYIIDSIKK
ncbi:DNA-binding response regulator [Candidatus Marinarcus aquaticus]|uniref:DNA-binding response regulator n=2 Tax=Candidatus Marinarcus aquaticus TaxID=2044504 RepID=A0A4Q0XTQ1_9BACT|nr:DNA-binding response regulator [Candidatus Marinarcus aquaticus]